MRLSKDEYKGKKLMNGYDYTIQAWVRDGLLVSCGHDGTGTCDCFGRAIKGDEMNRLEEELLLEILPILADLETLYREDKTSEDLFLVVHEMGRRLVRRLAELELQKEEKASTCR